MKIFFFVTFLLMINSINGQSFDSLLLTQVHEVYFDSGKYELGSEVKAQLDSILRIDETAIYDLEGHTDLVGSFKNNQKLSENRVGEVKAYLMMQGISEDNIRSRALGETEPKVHADKDVLENRRVTIKVGVQKNFRWVTGSIVDDSTNVGIESLVKIRGKNFLDSVFTNQQGDFKIAVPDKANYRMNVIANGYFFDERFIKVSKLTPVDFKVELQIAKVGAKFTLPNFNFKGNLAILMPRSIPTLNLLYETLSNTNVCIEVRGHVNRPNAPRSEIGSSDYKLSVDRAKMVKEAMIAKGIIPSRMVANGYSNWEMLFPTAHSAANQAKNRRVEVVVIDCKRVEELKN